MSVNFPYTLTSLVGSDIRTGTHPCYERVVIEFADVEASGGTLPGYAVGYVNKPIEESPSGLPTTVKGDAVLVIGIGAWMPNMDGKGYTGARRFTPTNVSHIKEVVQIENFEGMSHWAIGLDAKRNFTVFTLSSPFRLVVDIQTSP